MTTSQLEVGSRQDNKLRPGTKANTYEPHTVESRRELSTTMPGPVPLPLARASARRRMDITSNSCLVLEQRLPDTTTPRHVMSKWDSSCGCTQTFARCAKCRECGRRSRDGRDGDVEERETVTKDIAKVIAATVAREGRQKRAKRDELRNKLAGRSASFQSLCRSGPERAQPS